MQGIFQGFERSRGDVPFTVALELATDEFTCITNLSDAWHILYRSGNAAVVRP